MQRNIRAIRNVVVVGLTAVLLLPVSLCPVFPTAVLFPFFPVCVAFLLQI